MVDNFVHTSFVFRFHMSSLLNISINHRFQVQMRKNNSVALTLLLRIIVYSRYLFVPHSLTSNDSEKVWLLHNPSDLLLYSFRLFGWIKANRQDPDD